MSSVCLHIDGVETEQWALRITTSLEDATQFSSNNVRRATLAFPLHLWQEMPTSTSDTFIVQGIPKERIPWTKVPD
jgi:hypothetical protein